KQSCDFRPSRGWCAGRATTVSQWRPLIPAAVDSTSHRPTAYGRRARTEATPHKPRASPEIASQTGGFGSQHRAKAAALGQHPGDDLGADEFPGLRVAEEDGDADHDGVQQRRE